MLGQPRYLRPVTDAAHSCHSHYAAVFVSSQYTVLDGQRGTFRQSLQLFSAAIVCRPHQIPAEIRSRCILVTGKIQETLHDSVLTEATDDSLDMFYITLVLETAATLGMTRQYFRQDGYVLLAAITLHEHQNAASITPGSLDDPESVVLQAEVPRDILLWSPGSATTA